MNFRRASIWTLLIVAGMVLGWRAQALLAARAAAAEAIDLHRRLAQEVQEVQRLQSVRATSGEGKAPDQDVVGLVRAILAQALIAPAALRETTPEGERKIAGQEDTEQTVRVVLEPVSLFEVGQFLHHLRADQQVWRAKRIDLSARAGSPGTGAAYRFQVSLSARYVVSQAIVSPSSAPGAHP